MKNTDTHICDNTSKVTELSTTALEHLDKLPLGNAIKRYVEERKKIHCDFLTAIIEGDLFKASVYVDSTNRHLIVDYALFFLAYAPVDCYGSFEKKIEWSYPNYEDEPAEQ